MKNEESGIWIDAVVMLALAIILTLPFVSDAEDATQRGAGLMAASPPP
jgi:hypothetical protein